MTTPTPLPFAELLKRASVPVPVIDQTLDENEMTEEQSRYYGACVEIKERLLSWAHAGGVEELREAWRIVGEGSDIEIQLDRSLALLDGQREA